MSDKAHINPLDNLIRKTLRLGQDEGTFLRIEFVHGFEKFNTRPYHNYETWAGGYRIIDEHNNIRCEREDLDDALAEWSALVFAQREGRTINHWNRVIGPPTLNPPEVSDGE